MIHMGTASLSQWGISKNHFHLSEGLPLRHMLSLCTLTLGMAWEKYSAIATALEQISNTFPSTSTGFATFVHPQSQFMGKLFFKNVDW